MPKMFIAIALLVGAIGILAVTVWKLRNIAKSDDASDEPAWTLNDLAKMREIGQINEEQFQQLRVGLVNQLVGSENQQNCSPIRPESAQTPLNPGRRQQENRQNAGRNPSPPDN